MQPKAREKAAKTRGVRSEEGASRPMTDEEWAIVEPLLPGQSAIGRHRSVDMRRIVDALIYKEMSGCRWEALPDRFHPVSTVQSYFYYWVRNGTCDRINNALAAFALRRGKHGPDDAIGLPDRRRLRQTMVGFAAGEKLRDGFPGQRQVPMPRRDI